MACQATASSTAASPQGRQRQSAARQAVTLRAAPSPSGWRPSRQPGRPAAPLRAAADDSEVAVFRFTLGNDTADALVPRVVGGVGAALLVLNHLLGEEPSQAQVRAEALGAALAAAAIVTPTIEQRLKELQPGRGRQAVASSVNGASSVFALLPSLPDATKQELAWASFALLRNTNICGLAVFWEGRPVLARGLLAVPGAAAAAAAGKGGKAEAAAAALDALAAGGSGWQAAAATGAPLYCPDRAAMAKAGAVGWAGVPEGAESLLAQPLVPLDLPGSGATSGNAGAAPKGLLLLLSERPRALSAKERGWAAAVAAKLQAELSQGA